MNPDEIRSFLDHFRHMWERQDVTSLMACYADDCVVVSPIFGTLAGKARVEKQFVDLFKAFHTHKITLVDTVIGNDAPPRAVIVWDFQSSQIGEVFGMPPSGKRVERNIAFLLTIDGGLITRETRIYDFTSMLIQLGVLKVKPAN